ncbi:secreted protein [Rhodopirellula europaea 6C]|uniref:Secreted protein n=1 Tax=Rhodopirellula europaea 6C TaxID=1263867 RepID=M2B0M6_9BACT|nr:secreted protein [Rhodopirellula europaea 6C]
MRSLLAILSAIALLVGTGCNSASDKLSSENQLLPDREDTGNRQNPELEDLVASVRNALESREADRLQRLFYTESQPEDLTAVFQQQIKSLVHNDKLALREIQVCEFAEHEPDPPLPGEFNGSKLEFLRPPTHWIIANMGGVDGKATISLELTFPATKIENHWMLLGSRYGEE